MCIFVYICVYLCIFIYAPRHCWSNAYQMYFHQRDLLWFKGIFSGSKGSSLVQRDLLWFKRIFSGLKGSFLDINISFLDFSYDFSYIYIYIYIYIYMAAYRLFWCMVRAKAGRDSKSIWSTTVPGQPPELAGGSTSGHKLDTNWSSHQQPANLKQKECLNPVDTILHGLIRALRELVSARASSKVMVLCRPEC